MTALGAGLLTRGLVHIFHAQGHDVAALSGIGLTVAPGEMVGLLGPSGSGKSTLLLACAGLLRPTAGQLLIDGVDLMRLSDLERDRFRTQDLGVALQGGHRNVLGHLDIVENIRFAQRGRRASESTSSLPDPDELAALVGLAAPGSQRADTLDPTTLQLLALCCALANRPRLLLVDEPTSQLRPAATERVLAALFAANRTWGTTVLLVTHDAAVADRLPRTVTIRDGRIGAEGRLGEEYSVITADGSLTLPPSLLADHPPGTLLRVVPDGRDLRLEAVYPDAAPAAPPADQPPPMSE